MADFCAQCSIDLFGKDFRDTAGITTAADWAAGKAAAVLCEGCGLIQVDPEGRCVSPDCAKRHGREGDSEGGQVGGQDAGEAG